ncbi:putative odorant receptor 69a [Pogonomyrmex barbatus]|uniref:Odorant receptor n=1 Tax=Pogonomyrmex barbatus TaxID=144034 RepID=A0A8N1S9N4_9HYME|nr:putative odorant receptor 69a [Pogonomyrmex barbatus]
MIFHRDVTVTLSVHRFFLSCVGIWPVIPVSIYLTEIYLHCNGAKKSFDWITPSAAGMLALTRLITPRIHREELVEIVTSMMDDWVMQKDKKIRWVMKKYATMSTRVTVLTFILVGIIVAVYIAMAISAITAKIEQFDNNNVSTSHKDGIQSCVFHSASSHQAFMIVQAMQMFVTGVLTFGTTSFFFGLAMYLCSQFDALSIKLSEFQINTAHRAIAEAVQRHCHLIRLAECMEESFNASVLVYLFVTSTLMCIDGYMLIASLPIGDLPMIIHSASVLLLMLIQLSFYTFAGDYLEMRSSALSYATYDCNWYELPASTAKNFQIILMRASIPHQLTAGKFVIMNMITFKDILKSTASYLSVLRIMLDE